MNERMARGLQQFQLASASITQLLVALKSDDHAVRGAAVAVLKKRPLEEVVPPLCGRLSDHAREDVYFRYLAQLPAEAVPLVFAEAVRTYRLMNELMSAARSAPENGEDAAEEPEIASAALPPELPAALARKMEPLSISSASDANDIVVDLDAEDEFVMADYPELEAEHIWNGIISGLGWIGDPALTYAEERLLDPDSDVARCALQILIRFSPFPKDRLLRFIDREELVTTIVSEMRMEWQEIRGQDDPAEMNAFLDAAAERYERVRTIFGATAATAHAVNQHRDAVHRRRRRPYRGRRGVANLRLFVPLLRFEDIRRHLTGYLVRVGDAAIPELCTALGNRATAAPAIAVLEQIGVSAVPALTESLKRPAERSSAQVALRLIGPRSLPYLLEQRRRDRTLDEPIVQVVRMMGADGVAETVGRLSLTPSEPLLRSDRGELDFHLEPLIAIGVPAIPGILQWGRERHSSEIAVFALARSVERNQNAVIEHYGNARNRHHVGAALLLGGRGAQALARIAPLDERLEIIEAVPADWQIAAPIIATALTDEQLCNERRVAVERVVARHIPALIGYASRLPTPHVTSFLTAAHEQELVAALLSQLGTAPGSAGARYVESIVTSLAPTVMGSLISRLRSPNDEVRAAASRVLAAHSARIGPWLVGSLPHRDTVLRKSLLRLLLPLRYEPGRSAVVRVYNTDSDDEVRLLALQVWGELPDASGGADLAIEALLERNVAILTEAARQLERRSTLPGDLRDPLEHAYEWVPERTVLHHKMKALLARIPSADDTDVATS